MIYPPPVLPVPSTGGPVPGRATAGRALLVAPGPFHSDGARVVATTHQEHQTARAQDRNLSIGKDTLLMTRQKPPPLPAPADPQDPYKMRGIEQILSLFDGGDFLTKLLADHKQLQLDLLEYREEHGTKGCKGSMTIKIDYALGKSGDVGMGATAEFKSPKKPPSSAPPFGPEHETRAREVADFLRDHGAWTGGEFVTLTIEGAEFVVVDI